MEFMMFRGDGQAQIIRAVNDWLQERTGVAIRRTETANETTGETPDGGGKTELVFRIWYEQAP